MLRGVSLPPFGSFFFLIISLFITANMRSAKLQKRQIQMTINFSVFCGMVPKLDTAFPRWFDSFSPVVSWSFHPIMSISFLPSPWSNSLDHNRVKEEIIIQGLSMFSSPCRFPYF